MTTEEAKKIGEICSMLNAKERASLQKYLAEIVLRDSLQKLQITPQDVIIQNLRKATTRQKIYFSQILATITPNQEQSKIINWITEEQKVVNIQFAEYDNIKVKNTLKSNHQTF
jgi:Tfp pilus assembly PilM family ATPase